MKSSTGFLYFVSIIVITNSLPVRQGQILSSLHDIQREYESVGRSRSKENIGSELENVSDAKPEVNVDNIENAESAELDNGFKPKDGAGTEKAPEQSMSRKNKMLGYLNYFAHPAQMQSLAYPTYYPLEYYDDYLPLDGYPSLNMLANVPSYQQNILSNPTMGTYPMMNNLGSLQDLSNNPAYNLPVYGNMDNSQTLGNYQNGANFQTNENFPNLDEEDILSRNNQAGRRRPGVKNSPIYYIRLPPTPYMFVPGLGYISQPPTVQPMATPMPQYPQLAAPPPVTMSPFYNVPINFVSNGKPSGIYQWSGAAPAAPLPQPAFALPYPRPQRPAFRPFIQDSKVTHLKNPFMFNGRPEEIFLLQNAYNPMFQSPLNAYY